MAKETSVRVLLALVAFFMTASIVAQAQVPPVGPSGPTGVCSDKHGNRVPCK